MTKLAYLGLGSNLNNPLQQIARSITHLNRLHATRVCQLASLYQSKPWGVEAQPNFINTAICIETKLSPLALLKAIKIIEYRLMQRQINLRWYSRVIDIDLLLMDGETLNRQELTLPHAWIARRCFVIKPLIELSPNLPIKLKQQLHNHLKTGCCSATLTPVKTPNFIKNRLKSL